jgi:hypothetical protein
MVPLARTGFEDVHPLVQLVGASFVLAAILIAPAFLRLIFISWRELSRKHGLGVQAKSESLVAQAKPGDFSQLGCVGRNARDESSRQGRTTTSHKREPSDGIGSRGWSGTDASAPRTRFTG